MWAVVNVAMNERAVSFGTPWDLVHVWTGSWWTCASGCEEEPLLRILEWWKESGMLQQWFDAWS